MTTFTTLVPNYPHPEGGYKPMRSNSKKGTIEVEARAAAPAGTVTKLVDGVWRTWAQGQEQLGDLVRVQTQPEVQGQPGDLVGVQAPAVAGALARAQTLAEAWMRALAAPQAISPRERTLTMAMRKLEEQRSKALTAKLRARKEADARVQAQRRVQALAWAKADPQVQASAWAKTDTEVQAQARAQASAWALELAGMRKAMRVWMQGQGQGQTWQRMSALEACKVEVEHGSWPQRRQDCWWLIQIITPISRLPSELLHQIFLILIDSDSDNVSPVVLMRVSKYWYNMVAGIWASLKLGTTTPTDAITRKLERSQWLLDVVVDTEIDRRYLTQSNSAYQAIFAAMQATSRWRSLEIVALPAQADLPEGLVSRGLQQCSGPTLSNLRTFIIKCCCDMSPLLDRLLHILGNTASRKLTTVTINSENVISLLVPTYSSIFHSVTVLSLDAPWLRNPVDLLPHLHQLEEFTASHLLLPVYQNDVNLPFVHTLRHLKLTSVSIQWMSGRTFHVLESCKLVPSLDSHVLPTFRTALPTCKHLSLKHHSLDILMGVSAHKPTRLSVKCYSLYKERGSPQLVRFASQALRANRLAPHILHITIEATDQAWAEALPFMSNVEELVIYNVQPSSLGAKSLQPLVLHPVQANNAGTTAIPGGCNTPVCPSLRQFGLRYLRWLQPYEPFDLIPVLISIIRSRQQSMFSMQSLRIWTKGDEDGPFELIEGSSVSSKGLERLKKYAAITGQEL